jgi:hypothetical protein
MRLPQPTPPSADGRSSRRRLNPARPRPSLLSADGTIRWTLSAAGAALLLAGPTALAFFSGGFFDRPRLIAALVAWAVALSAAFSAPRPLPASVPGRVALAGLAALVAWTALSLLWAPVAGAAVDDLQRLLLYVGYAAGAVALFGQPWVVRGLEPALAAGALVVTGYGLSERLLPDLVDLDASLTAGGRLEQPLTYWNATGVLAALGLVLCLRMAGDPRRKRGLRAATAAGAVPLAAGVYLSFSRGALAALAFALVVLLALAPAGRAQARALATTLLPGAAAALLAGALPAVRALEGDLGSRRLEGLAMLLALIVLAGLAALLTMRATRGNERDARLPLARRSAVLAIVGVLLLGGALAAAAFEAQPESRSPAFGASAARLGSVDSNRYAYWRVALGTFADHPLQGIGSGGFVVDWLQERDVLDPTREPHSLYLGTLAELGLVGLAALLAFLGGVAVAARRLWRADPTLAAGPIAALACWAVHAGLDWDWEMPAVTLVALALASALVAWSERSAPTPEEREGSTPAAGPRPLASAPDPPRA